MGDTRGEGKGRRRPARPEQVPRLTARPAPRSADRLDACPITKGGRTRDWDKEGANSRLPVLKATGLMADRQAEHPTRKDLDDYPAIMTLADYCEYYGISKQTGRHWIAEGRATRMPGHRHIKILRESVRNYERALLEESVSPAQQSSGDRRGV